MSAYPDTAAARGRWVIERRGPREAVDPWKPNGFFVEDERSGSGEVVPVATVLLANRECPFRCVMCDLWRHTLEETVPPGAITAQVDHALARLPAARQVKLYNSGSFFDPKAIPTGELPGIAARLEGFERVVVECHPAFLGEACLRFRDALEGELEVAVGLETAHPDALERLNKGMDLDRFRRAAGSLREHGIGLRVFLLVRPPFLGPPEAADWTLRSIGEAFDNGATAVSLIPTRLGNGALESLAGLGEFEPPTLGELERAHEAGIALGRCRVFADLWDLATFSRCATCFPARLERLRAMNLEQVVPPPVSCPDCG